MNGEMFSQNQLDLKIAIMELCTTFPFLASSDRWTYRFTKMYALEFTYIIFSYMRFYFTEGFVIRFLLDLNFAFSEHSNLRV